MCVGDSSWSPSQDTTDIHSELSFWTSSLSHAIKSEKKKDLDKNAEGRLSLHQQANKSKRHHLELEISQKQGMIRYLSVLLHGAYVIASFSTNRVLHLLLFCGGHKEQ